MTKSPKKDRGFTLIEVLAALIVFSIAILGLSQAGSQSVRSVGVLENRMLAGIVADNVLVLARTREPVLGRQDGEQTQMGRKFDWELDIERTDVPGFLELTVNVRAQDTSQVLITRTAYLSQQRRTAPASGTSPGQGAKP